MKESNKLNILLSKYSTYIEENTFTFILILTFCEYLRKK